MKKVKRLAILFAITALVLVGCSTSDNNTSDLPYAGEEIVFANAGWDSIQFHNAVVGTIAQQIWGYSWSEVPGSTPVTHEGIIAGDIDAHTEVWTDNIPTYGEDLEAGKLIEVGVNFDDNYQGVYVPRYVIEGDEERGIEPMAPDLQYVWDLKDYPHIFPDDDNPEMGRMYGAIPGWEVDDILHAKYLHHGLDENFVYFRPGSDAALSAAITAAIDRGEAIASYYWEPTWLLGLYDMVLLEDDPYNEETFLDGIGAFPPVNVTTAVSNDFAEAGNEEFIEFFSKYRTSSQMTSEALGYMQDNSADFQEAVEWFLTEHDALLDDWLQPEDAQTLRDYLNS